MRQLSYDNLRTHPDLGPGQHVHFDGKWQHMRQLLPGRFFNAKVGKSPSRWGRIVEKLLRTAFW